MSAPLERLPANYNPNARCEFHSGSVGHDVGNCLDLKYAVQNLLDSKDTKFTPDNGPNVIQNPMPAHNGPTVNVIKYDESFNLIMDVNFVTTPLPFVKEYLIKNDVYRGCFPECCKCKSHPEGCDDLKAGIQSLITEWFLQFDRIVKDKKIEETDVAVISISYTPINISALARPASLTITLLDPIPYFSENIVPWTCGSEVYYHGVKQEEKPFEEHSCVDEKLSVDNLTGTGRITRSVRVFPSPNTQNNADALAKAKGKQVMEDNQEPV